MTPITVFKGIPDLPTPSGTLTGTEVFEIVQFPGTNGATSVQVQLNQLGSLIGSAGSLVPISSGSPQGAVSANPGAFYFDQVGEALWLKVSGSNTNGWTQLI